MRNITRSRRRRHEPMNDGLPEQMHYVDNGCEVSMECLNCPLPKCRFDDPMWYRALRREGRDVELRDAHDLEGLSVFEIARRHRISPRTVHRALQRVREPMAVAS